MDCDKMAEIGHFVPIHPYEMEMMLDDDGDDDSNDEEEEKKTKRGRGREEGETKGYILYSYIATNLSHCLTLQLFQNSENHTHRYTT
jgi:hypothetical protein